MSEITLAVNNGRTIKLSQVSADGVVFVDTIDSKGTSEDIELISPSDMVMMLNWYRYQKDHGNETLDF